MIIYTASKQVFSEDIISGTIESKIQNLMLLRGRKGVSKNEVSSWRNSLMYMNNVMQDVEIPNSTGVSIEYHIPNCSKRIDFIISGADENKKENLVIVELKQWSEATATTKPSIVSTFVGGNVRETPHPSYQAWSYAQLIKDFNQTVQDENIEVSPCAFLHNYQPDGVINGPIYKEDCAKAPVFLKQDALKLREFVKKWIKYGDDKNLLFRIDQGKIRPSKSLTDHMVALLKGSQEFVMIDDQKVTYETALSLLNKTDKKQVLIIQGGPGTGKSVVAINLLVEILNRGRLVHYVTKNAAPRAVYEAKLVGHMKKSQVSNLFVGSGKYHDADKNSVDALVVDEAHRLNEKSGMFQNLGENQVKEIINAARLSIFFVDESQKVTTKDIGTTEEISKWAKKANAEITQLELSSQFRCNGSDGYVAWLDNTLQVRETANQNLDQDEYDFRVYESATEMDAEIQKLNKGRNKSRLVAGYCWDWISKKDKKAFDIVLDDGGYKRQWNLSDGGGPWIIAEESVSEIGCIHTCQGLELDYVGVIIGPDFVIRSGEAITDFNARSSNDSSLKGLKGLAKKNLPEAKKIADEIIKNTYRTLMTRGMKGCFLYCTDSETREYFRSVMGRKIAEYSKPSTKLLKAADHDSKSKKKKL